MNDYLLGEITAALSKNQRKIGVQTPPGSGVVSVILAAVRQWRQDHQDERSSISGDCFHHHVVSISGEDLTSAIHSCSQTHPEASIHHACLSMIRRVSQSELGVIHVHFYSDINTEDRDMVEQIVNGGLKNRYIDLRKTRMIFSGTITETITDISVSGWSMIKMTDLVAKEA